MGTKKEKKVDLPDPNIVVMQSDEYRAQALKWIELRKIAYKICKTIGYVVPILATIVETIDTIWG